MIVPMKKVTLYALKQDREALLESLQRSGELMVIATEDSVPQPGSAEAQQALQRTADTLSFIDRCAGKKGMFAQRPVVPGEALFFSDPQIEQIQQEAEQLEEGTAALASQITSLKSQLDALTPWLPLDTPVEQLKNTRCAAVHTGFIPLSARAAVEEAVETGGGDLTLLADGPEGTAAVLLCHKDDEEALMDAVKEAGFLESAPPRISGLPKDAAARLEKEIGSLTEELSQKEDRVRALAEKREALEVLYDKQATDCDRLGVQGMETDATFRLLGWARSDRMDKVEKAVASVTDAYDLTIEDPAEDEDPPTVTKNNWFTRQFEAITDQFSRPHKGEVDPNPLMAPCYWLLYGMMLSDAGYGLVLIFAILAFKKLKKPRGDFAKLVNVIWLGSFTTAFWGVMFGSWFGETWNPIIGKPLFLTPLYQPVEMMCFCLVVGLIHIILALGLNAYGQIRHGHALDGILDNLPWMLVLVGLAGLLAPQVVAITGGNPLPAFVGGGGKWLFLAGALLVLCTAGRKKKGIGKLVGGLGGLYNITGYVSDILSYTRIFALSLATGVVGMVMNILAGMVQGSIIGFVFSLAIYLVGHVFNIAMNVLGSYVHTSRLQYIEFFGKFYEGGGYAFTPMQPQLKYVELKQSEQ